MVNTILPFSYFIAGKTPREVAGSRSLISSLEHEGELIEITMRSSARTPQKSRFIDVKIAGVPEVSDGFLRIFRSSAGIYSLKYFDFLASEGELIRSPSLEEADIYQQIVGLLANQKNLSSAAPHTIE